MKYLLLFITLLCATFCVQSTFAECTYNAGDIQGSFKNCNPELGIDPRAGTDYNVQKEGSDFRTFVGTMTRRIQIFTSIIAIGMIVWIGLTLVLPFNAEEKESAKGKLISVVLGFLAMIAATLLVNGLINLIYEIFR